MKNQIKIFIFLPILLLLSGIAPNQPGDPTGPGDNKNRFSASEMIFVKIMSNTKVKEMVLAPETGTYKVIADGRELMEVDAQNALKLTLLSDSIELKSFEKYWGKFVQIRITSSEEVRSFKIKCLNPERKPRYFDDNLTVSVEGGLLKLINDALLDHYIAGVAEAEAGQYSPPEFYKVQAILARTYALSYITKHQQEGFNLCDQVHCQAFYGKTFEPKILKAVDDTRGKVVVDEDMNLIVAVFHSNSGGQTVNSEDVWGAPTAYLKSVPDTFSLKMPNAVWARKMSISDWLDYLKIKHHFPVEDSAARWAAMHFRQDRRKINLDYGAIHVPLKNVRSDLQLKSTYFSIQPVGDSLLFTGRGFGHGIGMCQEGAMRMTKSGYSYLEVMNYYYKHVHLIDLKELNFFRDVSSRD